MSEGWGYASGIFERDDRDIKIIRDFKNTSKDEDSEVCAVCFKIIKKDDSHTVIPFYAYLCHDCYIDEMIFLGVLLICEPVFIKGMSFNTGISDDDDEM